MSTTATVTTIPNCDLCGALAYADCRIPAYSTWGNVCKVCFDRFKCTLGTGKGQEFILASATALGSTTAEFDAWMDKVNRACTFYVGCDTTEFADFGLDYDYTADFAEGLTPGVTAAKAISAASKFGF